MLAFAADQDRLAAPEPLGSERLAGAASAGRLGWPLRLAGVVVGRGRRRLVGGPSRLALLSSFLAAIRVVARRRTRTGSGVFGQTRVLRPRQRQKLARRRQQILMRQPREVRRRQGLQIVRESVRHTRGRIAFPSMRKPKMRKIVDPSPLRRNRPTHRHHRPREEECERLHVRGLVIVTAHRWRSPPKYGFSLLFRGCRVLGLGRHHRNLFAGGSVSATHWQSWPAMEAEPDQRDLALAFRQWLDEFMTVANASCVFQIKSPPFGGQLEMRPER